MQKLHLTTVSIKMDKVVQEYFMMLKLIFAISLGSIAGGLSRWFLSLKLNSVPLTIPLGTLLSNLIAGYVIGFAIAFFNDAHLSPEWQLLIITGFCGGLSTFSTFSAEIVRFLQDGHPLWGILTIMVHVSGSVLMTFLGIWSMDKVLTSGGHYHPLAANASV